MPDDRQTLILSGPFTTDELVELGALLRRFDERGPDRHFHLMMPKADGTLEKMAAVMSRVFPEAPGRETEIQVFEVERPSASGRMPLHWMNETTGVLRPAIEAYLFGHDLTEAHIGALRAYFRLWCGPYPQDQHTQALIEAIDGITNRRSLQAWLDSALLVGIDPL